MPEQPSEYAAPGARELAERILGLEHHTNHEGGLMALLRGYLHYLSTGGSPIDPREAEQIASLLLRHQTEGQRVQEALFSAYQVNRPKLG